MDNQDHGRGLAYPARMWFSGPEHAVMAEELLMGRVQRYRAVSDRIAAAQVHAQLAFVAMMAQDRVRSEWDVDAADEEWAQALVIHSPAARADDELAALVEGEGGDR